MGPPDKIVKPGSKGNGKNASSLKIADLEAAAATASAAQLLNPDQKNQDDEEWSNDMVEIIRREFVSTNKNYYGFFQVMPPGQDWAPLSTEEIARVRERGERYLKAVEQSKVDNGVQLIEFMEDAVRTMSDAVKKKQYDEERWRKNLEEMKGGEDFQKDVYQEDVNMDDVDEEDSENDQDDSLFVQQNGQTSRAPDGQLLRQLYNAATLILKAYLSQADDPNKKPEELAKEKYEPLDQYNEDIVKKVGEVHREEFMIQYTFLKALFRQVSQLRSEINTAGAVNTTASSNKLTTVHRQVQKYLVDHHFPYDWALLLDTPVPDADFDTSIPAQWDALYHAFPRSPSEKDVIFIAWISRVKKDKRNRTGIFVMTPLGLDCRFDDPSFSSFKTDYPQYEYICTETVRPYKGQLAIFKDAWSAGGRRRDGHLNPIYCLMQLGDAIRVITCTTSDTLARGTKVVALNKCKEKGITFDKPVETGLPSKRAPGVPQGDPSSHKRAISQNNATGSSKDTETSNLRHEISQLKSALGDITSMLEKLTIGGHLNSPVTAQ
ncbi:hypothetical protein S40285_10717 [Stachybotrys chlorohalonatus IBT 40285]|uniref:Uncharacterized protein n=1 Tax=Stachybotrys chlorohalonatus (strain IBT 40285) TaxID=1283841 RepID=A0A084QZB1_STAC4|nr:hypothetical protein S40285_10717 [Stachybotrys chlorohalonata IBT 40285]